MRTIAPAINDAGQVVAFSTTDQFQFPTFITGPDGAGMTDPGSLMNPPPGFAYFSRAIAIDNHRQRVAVAAVIPEPQMYAMLLSGLGLIGFFARGRATAEEFTIPGIKDNFPLWLPFTSCVCSKKPCISFQSLCRVTSALTFITYTGISRTN
jgi:hypothetical protein